MSISAKVSALNEDVAVAPANAIGIDGTIAINQPGKVLLSLSPDDVQVLQRDGNDLLIQTADGQFIRIENFYGSNEAAASQLYLTDENQELIWADLGSASSDSFLIADYVSQGEFGVFAPATMAGENAGAGITPLGWAAIGGGALAAGALAAGGGGGGGNDGDDTPPDDGEDGEGDTTPPRCAHSQSFQRRNHQRRSRTRQHGHHHRWRREPDRRDHDRRRWQLDVDAR
ncbi:BapA/Bap/LapF family prefix-like domain-containing protein [Salinicola halimionae]|uniref:BapA/Bap/LapF family prefix-like domain-containing protein n=1 Tax=Salinicola halimionae TaxID=1949081 RepID=UPI0013004B16|nr:BapA prefix-like domain-containing protein [Salinicola halimionae]